MVHSHKLLHFLFSITVNASYYQKKTEIFCDEASFLVKLPSSFSAGFTVNGPRAHPFTRILHGAAEENCQANKGFVL